jgi:4-hydroxybenzoate polyprenyltransferase
MFGAMIFAERLDRQLFWRLALLYLSFNVLLYSGLYTINDLADRESDAQHPLKRHRPIASGRVSVHAAARWAAAFLIAGFVSGFYLFGRQIVWCYVAIAAINLLYSLGGRNVAYLDAVLNGLPHVVRFVMGVVLVGRWPPTTHLIAFALLATAFSVLRRRIEHDVPGWEARQSLRDWSVPALDRVLVGSLIGVIALAIFRWRTAPGFYTALLGTMTVLIGGAYSSASIRRALSWVWTR